MNGSSTTENTGKTKSRQQIYQMFEPHAAKAIDVLVQAMDKGNTACKIGAAKTILAKLAPDLKATELSGPDGQQFTINLIRDYITKTGGNVPTSDSSIEGSEPIQGSNMAQTSKKDIDTVREDGNRVP